MSNLISKPQSIFQTYEDFLFVYDWLSSKVKIASGSRLDTYKKVFGKLIEIDNGEKRFAEYLKNQDQANNSFYEINEFASLRKLIQLEYLEIPQNTLVKLVKGPISYTAEKDDSAFSRNYLYELAVASRFAERSDVQIDLTRDEDILLNYKLYQFVIECKRIRSEKQLVTNISKAAKQLKNRYVNRELGKQVRGLIFVSLSPVINPKLLFASSVTTNFISNGIAKDIDAIVSKYSYNITEIKDLKNKRTSGIICQATVPFMGMLNEGILSRSRVFPFNNSKTLLNEFLQFQ